MPNAETKARTIAVALLDPIATSPKYTNAPSATAQMKATIPWSMLGGFGGWIIAAIVVEAEEGTRQIRRTKKSRRARCGFVHSAG
jgi:hypothetical protein